MSLFIAIRHRPEGLVATRLVRSEAIPVRPALLNVDPTHRPRVLLATLTATIALVSLLLPVNAAVATIAATATGSGHTIVAGELRTFSLAAWMEADGVAAGTAQVDNREINEKFQLGVDCLKVVGSFAIVSGAITRHTDVHAIGLTGIFGVQDSGEGLGAPPDLATQVFFFRPGVLRCTDLDPADAAPFLVAIDAGNIQVK